MRDRVSNARIGELVGRASARQCATCGSAYQDHGSGARTYQDADGYTCYCPRFYPARVALQRALEDDGYKAGHARTMADRLIADPMPAQMSHHDTLRSEINGSIQEHDLKSMGARRTMKRKLLYDPASIASMQKKYPNMSLAELKRLLKQVNK